MAKKFEEGSLAALVATGHLGDVAKATTNREVLAIIYAQRWIPEDKLKEVDAMVTQEETTSLTLATWLTDLAYKTWLALKPKNKTAAYSFMPDGTLPTSTACWAVR